MTPTPYSNIFDLSLMLVNDYDLVQLYESSENDLQKYLQGFLIFAIADFKKCIKDLTQRSDSTATFLIELSDWEQTILAKLLVKYWFKQKIQDVTQFQGKLNDRDFKTYSEAQNLASKMNYYNMIREEVAQDINDYGYTYSNWLQ